MGSAALSLSMVALGGTDAFFDYGLHAWDIAAGDLIVREAGGVVLDPSGGPLDLMSRRVLAAATPELANQLANILTQYYPLPRDWGNQYWRIRIFLWSFQKRIIYLYSVSPIWMKMGIPFIKFQRKEVKVIMHELSTEFFQFILFVNGFDADQDSASRGFQSTDNNIKLEMKRTSFGILAFASASSGFCTSDMFKLRAPQRT